MLTKIDGDVERNHTRMIKVDTKLKKFMKNSNHWCVWIIIVIEIILLIIMTV